MSARWVVTLPPAAVGPVALDFAHRARARGAELLELRTDLHADAAVDAAGLSRVLPLIVSQRKRLPSEHWIKAAWAVDRPMEEGAPWHPNALMSHHATGPLRPEEALSLWRGLQLPSGAAIKHVEPLGEPSDGDRLIQTQSLLEKEFGTGQVTVLAMGRQALPFRCVLSAHNALEYVAWEGEWQAAPGQRLLQDAVRDQRFSKNPLPRMAILGSRISGSRSPRIHPQPFDRIDLPEDTPVGAVVDALHPFYRGFAITSPFKKPLALHVGAEIEAINTLVRKGSGWAYGNTDLDGARAVLERLESKRILVLGDGGVTPALRRVAQEMGVELNVRKRDQAAHHLFESTVIWTWPAHVDPPLGLSLKGARVAIIAYGPSARRVAERVRQLGGLPVFLGACWFVAQARGQRRLWETAT